MSSILWEKQIDENQLPQVALEIITQLQTIEPFCLWLKGTLGAGKSTLTRSMLRSIGLDKNQQIPSPTFTYFIEYCIDNSWYVHCDFYRFSPTSAAPLDELNYRDYRGYFIEWPENYPEQDAIMPTHILEIEIISAKKRNLLLKQVSQES